MAMDKIVVAGALTLRDYHAAHAPAPPLCFETWFRQGYALAPARPDPDKWMLTSHARMAAGRYFDDPRLQRDLSEYFKNHFRPPPGEDHAPSDLEGLRNFQHVAEQWRAAHSQWEREREIDLLVTWAMSYATAMCAAAPPPDKVRYD